MKLHFTTASPFVRKVMITAIELGVEDRIDLIPAAHPTVPTEQNTEIAADNPLVKVPTLILPDGEALWDSSVICEYLNSLADNRSIIPVDGPARWRALRLAALADGILEAGIAVRYERLRPPHLQWEKWIDGQLLKIRGALDFLEKDLSLLTGEFEIGQIAVAAALPWLEFRGIYPGLPESHSRLFGWLAGVQCRPSMISTRPS
jgi:glutathione S-transferase